MTIVAFREVLSTSLEDGSFRLVLVLDDIPRELPRLVGYLETIGERITIDLVAINVVTVNGAQVVVPRRVSDESELNVKARKASGPSSSQSVDGSEEFASHIDEAPEENRVLLRKLLNWAKDLESQNLVKLTTSIGKANRYTLVPKLPSYGSGLVTIWNENNAGYISVYRTVFEKLAPDFIDQIETLIAPIKMGSGNSVRAINDELLDVLTNAHKQASGGMKVK